MIGESVNFMITGMTVVFMFLVIMVLVLEAQGKLINYFIASEKSVSSNEPQKNSGITSEAKRAAIISAAVKHHIAENSKK
ncbi:MAG: OadG family transporter subunit [Thermodesulfobacteriota bacteirum]|jgi:oxaloacetate decarboxylase gamma subunit|nr:OadG family transporter subunit [Thermodesulfobacteriota bacterium]